MGLALVQLQPDAFLLLLSGDRIECQAQADGIAKGFDTAKAERMFH